MARASIYDIATVRTPHVAAPMPPQERSGMDKLRSIMASGISFEVAYAQCLASTAPPKSPSRADRDQAIAAITQHLSQGYATAGDIASAVGLLQPMVWSCLKSMKASGTINIVAPRKNNAVPAVWGLV